VPRPLGPRCGRCRAGRAQCRCSDTRIGAACSRFHGVSLCGRAVRRRPSAQCSVLASLVARSAVRSRLADRVASVGRDRE
jgi:hypothetical protein